MTWIGSLFFIHIITHMLIFNIIGVTGAVQQRAKIISTFKSKYRALTIYLISYGMFIFPSLLNLKAINFFILKAKYLPRMLPFQPLVNNHLPLTPYHLVRYDKCQNICTSRVFKIISNPKVGLRLEHSTKNSGDGTNRLTDKQTQITTRGWRSENISMHMHFI